VADRMCPSQKQVVIALPSKRTWQPHPQLPGVAISTLCGNQLEDTMLTCALVRIDAGVTPAKHIHKNSDDIVYVLQGRGAMWIEDIGDVILEPGAFVRIPKGLLHQPHSVTEDLVIYDVWSPNCL